MKNTPRLFVWWIVASAFLICINALAARAQSVPVGVDVGCSPTVANPCRGSSSAGSSTGRGSTPRESTPDDSDERAARNARYDAKYSEADAARNREDWREALRLFTELQKLRDGPTAAFC